MKCCGIEHERMGNYRNRPPKFVICTDLHKIEDHYCGVTGCNKRKGKICVHVIAQYVNCGGSHAANFPRCILRQKTDIQIRKNKKIKEKGSKEKMQVYTANNEAKDEKREESPLADTKMDLEDGKWAQSPRAEGSKFYDDKSQDHTKKY